MTPGLPQSTPHQRQNSKCLTHIVRQNALRVLKMCRDGTHPNKCGRRRKDMLVTARWRVVAGAHPLLIMSPNPHPGMRGELVGVLHSDILTLEGT